VEDKINKTEKLVFFYPSYLVGGAQYLIIRLTEYFLEHSIDCYIIDFKDGIYRQLTKKVPENRFIEFKQNLITPEDAVIITYPCEIKKLSEYLDKNNKNRVLVWLVGPDNFEALIPLRSYLPFSLLKFYFYPLIEKSIKILSETKSLIAMDDGVLERCKSLYGVNYNIPYCPIPIKPEDRFNINNMINDFIFEDRNEFKCVWLGRISTEKVCSLKKVIKDIASLSNIKVEFDIIGNGECEHIIKEFKTEVPFKINFLNTVTENLDSILRNYDVCFAMGTSALESAKLGVPSVLVDLSYTELPDGYRYRWLYETEDFTLGYMLPTEKVKKNKLNMNDIFDILRDQEKKIAVGKRCYEYTINNHLIDTVAEKLLEFANSSILTMEDVRKLPANGSLLNKIQRIGRKIKSILK